MSWQRMEMAIKFVIVKLLASAEDGQHIQTLNFQYLHSPQSYGYPQPHKMDVAACASARNACNSFISLLGMMSWAISLNLPVTQKSEFEPPKWVWILTDKWLVHPEWVHDCSATQFCKFSGHVRRCQHRLPTFKSVEEGHWSVYHAWSAFLVLLP